MVPVLIQFQFKIIHILCIDNIWAATWENRIFAYAKTKTQISFAVTAKLISAIVFATRIVQSLYLLHSKFQASSSILWLYSPVCVGPGRKPRRPVFWRRGSYEGRAFQSLIILCEKCCSLKDVLQRRFSSLRLCPCVDGFEMIVKNLSDGISFILCKIL